MVTLPWRCPCNYIYLCYGWLWFNAWRRWCD
jgi:hypothetical protein